jgi:tetratricopeptide (TPR) repeat protein
MSPRFLLIGGAVLLLVAGAGWFLATRWTSLFPNSRAAETPAPAVADPLARARQLHAEGKTAMAIPQLRRIPPQDPHYAEAQTQISQWEALVRDAAQPRLSPLQAQTRRTLVEEARRALESGENVRARSLLEQARAIAPLEGADAALAATAQERLAGFADELRLYQQGDFEYLLNSLWRRRETEKGNRDLDRLIVDSYYNLGVLDLQRGDPGAARAKFEEALKLDANDAGLVRAQRFARVYETRGEDLLYRIFVKYLPAR